MFHPIPSSVFLLPFLLPFHTLFLDNVISAPSDVPRPQVVCAAWAWRLGRRIKRMLAVRWRRRCPPPTCPLQHPRGSRHQQVLGSDAHCLHLLYLPLPYSPLPPSLPPRLPLTCPLSTLLPCLPFSRTHLPARTLSPLTRRAFLPPSAC